MTIEQKLKVIMPDKCPKCNGIFIDYQNRELKCLVKDCRYIFTKIITKDKIIYK